MANATLMLHCGAKHVSREELAEYKAPPPSKRWYPLSHSRVLDVVTSTLKEAGYEIQKEQLGVMRDGSRFFGALTLNARIADGIGLALGVRDAAIGGLELLNAEQPRARGER